MHHWELPLNARIITFPLDGLLFFMLQRLSEVSFKKGVGVEHSLLSILGPLNSKEWATPRSLRCYRELTLVQFHYMYVAHQCIVSNDVELI